MEYVELQTGAHVAARISPEHTTCDIYMILSPPKVTPDLTITSIHENENIS